MLRIFKTVDDDRLEELDHFEEGIWVHLTNPTDDEIKRVCDGLNLDIDYVKAPLDEEEKARIESNNGNTLIIVDIPIVETDSNPYVYITIPLGIIVAEDSIVTICLKETPIITDFIENRVKTFYTYKKTRFILQILYRNAARYLLHLRQIDKASSMIERELHKSMKNKELIQLLDLEKSLVYFSTSLKANEIVMEKMLKFEYVKKYPDDTDLLEDVIVENKQAIEMANIYSNILSGTMDAFASIISNNLNMVMKFLTSVTIVMAIPTIVYSFFGMNVKLPFEDNPIAGGIIFLLSIVLCGVAAFILVKKKMF